MSSQYTHSASIPKNFDELVRILIDVSEVFTGFQETQASSKSANFSQDYNFMINYTLRRNRIKVKNLDPKNQGYEFTPEGGIICRQITNGHGVKL